MQLEKIVKVMNFQSLLRINTAKEKAESYKDVGEEITKIYREIAYNKNINLDKNILVPDPEKPRLGIYIANDYGFCGNFNAEIRHKILEDKDDYKIIIGKKIPFNDEKTVLRIDKDDFKDKISEIEKIINDGLRNMTYSEISLCYIHYYSFTQFEFKEIKLFPVEWDGEYYEGYDYVSESNIADVVKGLMSFYISYQIKMAEEISVASENVLRKHITDQALDRIKEMNEEKKNDARKEFLAKSIIKNVENFKRIMEEDVDE